VASAVARILEELKVEGGLQGKDIANIVAVSPATVSRWSGGRATPDIHTQTVIAALAYIIRRLADFYEPSEARLWLNAKHPLLDNARPIDLIRAGDAEAVLAVIDRLDAGVYL
jgi:putative toxin-antitoxin system antitoxin component (TIGR02293 family)